MPIQKINYHWFYQLVYFWFFLNFTYILNLNWEFRKRKNLIIPHIKKILGLILKLWTPRMYLLYQTITTFCYSLKTASFPLTLSSDKGTFFLSQTFWPCKEFLEMISFFSLFFLMELCMYFFFFCIFLLCTLEH